MGSDSYTGDKPQGQNGNDQHQGQIHQTNGFWDWMGENVAKPAINAAYLTPVNDLHLAGILDAPKPYEVKQGEFLSKEWLGQTVGSVAGVVPYIIAGRAIGGASRFAAEATGTEASWFGKFAASERLTMVAGAGVYDLVRTPHEGEARWSNALGSMAMFGMCEWGNSKILPSTSMVDAALTRMKYGAAGAASGYLLSRTLGPSHSFSPSDLVQTSLTGGLINFGLPALQHVGAKGADLIDNAIGRGVPAERVLSANGWTENGQLSELVNNPNGRLTRVVNGGEPMTDGKRVTKDRSADASTQQEQLAHEINHKINVKEMEAQFQQAKFYIGKNDPLHDPREMFINIRRADEAMSRQAGARAANKPITPDMIVAEDGRAPVQDAAHEAQFAREADQFIQSGGDYRPEVSYMHGGGAGRGGGRGSQDALLSSRRENFGSDRIKWDKDTNTWTIIGDPTKAEQSVLEGTGEKIDSIQYEYRIEKNKTTGQDEKVFERITRPKGFWLDGEVWDSVEFHKNGTQTPWGLADRIERLQDGYSAKYHIIKGDPERGVPDNSNYEVYPKGLTTEDHGLVQAILHYPDGTIHYDKSNGLSGWDYPEPKQWSFGDVNKIDDMKDGSTLYRTTDGSRLESFPEGQEVTLQAGDTDLGPVKNIFRSSNGEVHYEAPDKSNIYVRRVAGEMVVTRKRNGVVEPIEVSGPIVEVYPSDAFPNGHEIQTGANTAFTTRTEIHPDFTRTFTSSSITDEYTTPVERKFGQVKYTRYFPDMNVDFTTDNGRYEHYIKPRDRMSDPVESQARSTPRGMATGAHTDANGITEYDLIGRSTPQTGSTVTDYPLGLRTSLNNDLTGAITHVERFPNRVIYYTNANEALDVQLGSGGGIYKYKLDANGTILDTAQLPTREIVEFLGENGTLTPFGYATHARISTDGSIQYQIAADPLDPTRMAPYTDVREFPIPRQTELGQVTYAEHMRNGGMYRVHLSDPESPAIDLTDAQYRAILGTP
jgi:hypothetical protein